MSSKPDWLPCGYAYRLSIALRRGWTVVVFCSSAVSSQGGKPHGQTYRQGRIIPVTATRHLTASYGKLP